MSQLWSLACQIIQTVRHLRLQMQVLIRMRILSSVSSVWCFFTILYVVLSINQNVAATAVHTGGSSRSHAAPDTKRPRIAVPNDASAAGRPENPVPSTAIQHEPSRGPKKQYPECRNVSIGYHRLIGSEDGRYRWTYAREPGAPKVLPQASEESCKDDCESQINSFVSKLSAALRKKTTYPVCWASWEFSVVQRTSKMVSCGGQVCDKLPSFCMCTFNLMIPKQFNATKQEMRFDRYTEPDGSPSSVCRLTQFPTTLSHDLQHSGEDRKKFLTEQRNIHEVEKRSWPLFEWRSVPGQATVLEGPFACPIESRVTEAEQRSGGRGAVRQSRPIKEICFCPNVHYNGLVPPTQCSHTELTCKKISLSQARQDMERGLGDLLQTYMNAFPQLKDYMENLAGTAIATDQVARQDWERMIPAIDLDRQANLGFNLNEPAAEDHDEF